MTNNGNGNNKRWIAHLAQALAFVILGYVIASVRTNAGAIVDTSERLSTATERIAKVEAYMELSRESTTQIVNELRLLRVEIKELRADMVLQQKENR